MKIIDGTDLIAGRLATTVAKMALEGEVIRIVNADKVIISGEPKTIIKSFTDKIHRGNALNGPYQPRRADLILKRIIRGMLPYKKERGIKAFKRIKAFLGVPDEFKSNLITIKGISFAESNINKHISLGELSKRLGGSYEA